MIDLPINVFLDVFGNTATAGDMRGLATVKVVTDIHNVGMQNINSTRYMLTCSAVDFALAKQGTVFAYKGSTYKALKPPSIEQDKLEFECSKT